MADKRAKIWEIQTQLYDTYGQPYIDVDRLHSRLDELLKSGELANYAYVVHDRDRYTQEDEDTAAAEIANGSKRLPVKAGDTKPQHIHVELQLRNARTLSAVAKWLSAPDFPVPLNWVVYVRENQAGEAQTFDDKCAYLCHERQPDKTPYRYDEIVCSFDYAEMMKRYVSRVVRKGRNAASKAFIDEHTNKISKGEETPTDIINTFGYAVYEQGRTKYDHAYEHFLATQYTGPKLRLTILVTGGSTLGKTPLAKMLAASMFPDIKNPREVYFSTGDTNCAFQSYRGQPVIIWDDWRAVDFVHNFGREKLFSGLFSIHPEPTDYNIKYGSTVLRHQVNIITTVEGKDEFIRALAGEYTDKYGTYHKSEAQQVIQAYKRVWAIFELSAEQIVMLLNAGYQEGAAPELYQQFIACCAVQNRTRAIAEKYDARLYGEIGGKMFPGLLTEYAGCQQREGKKITDAEKIDAADIPMPIDLQSGGCL